MTEGNRSMHYILDKKDPALKREYIIWKGSKVA